MKLAVVGTGYVGLVSGVGLAWAGHNVTCVDLRQEVVERILRADPPIHEEGLQPLLRQTVLEGRLQATTQLAKALEEAELALIAVGTPSLDGRIDLAQIREACRAIGRHIRDGSQRISVVVKSTVVPGTTDTVVRGELENSVGRKHAAGAFGLGMNPEFLREGQAIDDFLQPDRIVLGADDAMTLDRLRQLYAFWKVDKVETNSRTAEMIKYANNSLLALQISAINELANVAFSAGNIDFNHVVQGVTSDKRWSPIQPDGSRVRPGILHYLIPGCGFGGSCFPKDVEAMRSFARDNGIEPRVLQAVLDVNHDQPGRVARMLAQHLGNLAGRRVLVLGLTFKPGTDDLRFSVARPVMKCLIDAGALVWAHDPLSLRMAAQEWHDAPFLPVDDWRTVLPEVDAVVLVTAWPEYLELADKLPRGWPHVVLDARSVLRAENFPTGQYLSFQGRRGSGDRAGSSD
jgi:UDPglucose 6-dehydrogenase